VEGSIIVGSLEGHMRVEIRVGRSGFRRWHQKLAARLRLDPNWQVAIRVVPGEAALSGSVEALLALERLVLRRSKDGLFDRLPPPPESQVPSDFVADAIVDCSGDLDQTAVGASTRTLRPLFGGLASEQALVAAILSGSIPDVGIEDVRSGTLVAIGKPGGGDSGLIGGVEAVLSRTTLLIERALRNPEAQGPGTSRDTTRPPHRHALSFALRNLAADCARAIFHLCFHSPHWRIGWRLHDGPGVLERGDLGGPRWTVLKDSGRSFFADPLPVCWNGKTFLFFEEFDYRLGRGVISAIEFDASGPVGPTLRVLEEPWHQSYPFIIEHGDALFMIPEASLTGEVPLYRCIAFPDRWERVGSILEGIEASDCTLFRHDGLLWMMSATREGVGGYSDTLSIHYAPDIFGPWTEHEQRPVVVDAGAARPAGRVVDKDGRLWRPIQDCTKGYGLGLVLAEITRLDPRRFEQTVRGRISPGPSWPGRRLHTLNRAGRLEVIDGATANSRLPMGWALPNPWAADPQSNLEASATTAPATPC
jgi:hypothetical protein